MCKNEWFPPKNKPINPVLLTKEYSSPGAPGSQRVVGGMGMDLDDDDDEDDVSVLQNFL